MQYKYIGKPFAETSENKWEERESCVFHSVDKICLLLYGTLIYFGRPSL